MSVWPGSWAALERPRSSAPISGITGTSQTKSAAACTLSAASPAAQDYEEAAATL
jgi:hypothetical protein